MLCSKGKENAEGERCPYCTSEPQTMEGWQAWDVALRCTGQLRMTQLIVIGLDMGAAIKIGEVLGYDATGLAELLPSCEAGMVAAMNEKIGNAVKDF